MAEPAVRFSGITKRFPGVVALNGVSFDVTAGTVHAVCGENGAGKSTLGKILAGIQQQDAGALVINGEELRFDSPRDALHARIAMVHQELAFCENMSVAENLCLGAIPSRSGFVSRSALHARAAELLAEIGAHLDTTRLIGSLSVAEQQLVQIAAAVGSGARIIVFDEPTSSLGEAEAQRLYRLIGELKARGVTLLYVSHRMGEIFKLCDDVTVLRDGQHVTTQPTSSLDEAGLIQLMIGRRVEQYFPAHTQGAPGDELLRVEHLTSPGKFEDVSFCVRAGEVVGLAGLVGAGRSEIAHALFGLDPNVTGDIYVKGRRVEIRRVRQAMALGIGYVPEDRKKQGLVLQMLARENTTLPTLGWLARLGWVSREREEAVTAEYLGRMNVREGLADAITATLSGGNQQKVVMAKWLAAKGDILIFDEPTRGVDVGAKAELHAWIDRLASSGTAVLLISSELPELLNLSSRILVLREGRMVGEVPRAEAAQDLLMAMMAGVGAGAGAAV